MSWKGKLPNLRVLVPPKEIERRLFDTLNYSNIDFTTRISVQQKFLDGNYTDEDVYTNFHAACKFGSRDVVENFLELGRVDPNLLVPETGDSPLHLALRHNFRAEVAELLLERGANPNFTNRDGSTSLHMIIQRKWYSDNNVLTELILKISAEIGQSALINAQDKLGNAPLHLASTGHRWRMFELLLTRGANPNLANEKGHTALHLMCQSEFNERYAEIYFRINDEKHQSVLIDARDRFGRTPLQWAVMHVWPNMVNLFLDRGADLSSFVFPTESDFEEGYKELKIDKFNFRLRIVSGILCIVESLEKRGYELDQNEALSLMKVLGRYWFDLEDLDECWYHDHEDELKKVEVKPSLSLYDVIRLEPKEAAKLLSYSDYFKLWRSPVLRELPWNFTNLSCAKHLCEKLVRGFFISWAVEPFWALLHGRLPIECCEIVVWKLANKDLLNICLATAGQCHKESENKERKFDTECDNNKIQTYVKAK